MFSKLGFILFSHSASIDKPWSFCCDTLFYIFCTKRYVLCKIVYDSVTMAPTTGSYPYPGFSNPYLRGHLPPVNKARNTGGSTMCAGRVMIFLILGVVLFVLGLASLGVYLNITSLTSSRHHSEIMPLFVTSGAILLSGICVSLLFWKRQKTLVFFTVVVVVAAGFLCGITAVLTCTHVLRPLQTFRLCRYYISQKLCLCYSPYKRDLLSLQFSDTEDTQYDFEDVTSCSDVEDKLPQLLLTLVVVYSLVFLLNIGCALLALLSLRAETIKQRFLGDESYDEVYTVSGNSSQDQSDSETETGVEVTTLPDPIITSKQTTSVQKPSSQFPNTSRVEPQLVETTPTGSVPKNLQGQRSRTPGPNDLGKESLANRYKINKTPDRDVTVRQRLSKTPDREIGASRRYSFSASKRLSKSCDSLESSGNDSREFDKNFGTDPIRTKKKGKLKEHRRKGKRAATVHTLDTDQLLLILNLQMRYLQETSEQQTNTNPTINTVTGTRRAITPQPVSQKTCIPQKVRSHTPQPRRANRGTRDQTESLYSQQRRGRNSSLTQGISSENSSRRTSESSEKNFDFIPAKSGVGKALNFESGSYLHSQQIKKSTQQNNPQPYNPYIHTQFENSPKDSVHFVTYSDSMLSNSNKPKSRSSAQDNCLPSRPLHRGSHNQLPPQPISRQRTADRQLPRQPVHRGSSAFHVVDRNSKSRSPSVLSDKIEGSRESLLKHKQNTDYAEYAIRDNFSMNTKQFIMTDARQQEPNVNSKRNQQIINQNSVNGNFTIKGGNSVPPENLPPYSGPPSYREYVSSCNTSVTSSLSSNPDDVYSMPKRRVKTDVEKPSTSEPGGTIFSVVSQRIENSSRPSVGITDSNIYGNSEIISDNLMQQKRNPVSMNSDINRVRGQVQGQSSNSQGQSSNSQGQEVIYSSPAKSKVKQCIVPEDYYASICNVRRQDVGPLMKPGGLSSDPDEIFANQKTMSDYNENRVMYESNGQHGFAGQIAPDAKYNEYEDVYDSAKSVNASLPQSVGPVMTNGFSVNAPGTSGASVNPYITSSSLSGSQGHVMGHMTPKVKPQQLNSVQKQTSYPVSNVHANMDFMNNSSGCYGNQASVENNVGNVHASNLNRIPCIKLNDADVDQNDDDVFLDNANVYKTLETAQWSGQDYPNNGPDVIQVPSDRNPNLQNKQQKHEYQEINDFESTNQNQVSDHVSNDNSADTDTGYMKMTLPEKDTTIIQKISDSANQVTVSDHVTSYSANQNIRPKPDGIDKGCEEDTESYAETGV